MIDVVTPAEMGVIDRSAPVPAEVLIARAGAAVARVALRQLGGAYGRRVVVVAGKGNNGADGRVAATRLRARGVGVAVVDAASPPPVLPPADVVIDAGYGTGFRGHYEFPDTRGAPVIAVDIPSGVDGSTGRASGAPATATATVTFAALKPGLLLGDGPGLAGVVEVVDIGLDTSSARAGLVTDADVVEWWPVRPADSHKWRAAVWVVGGSDGMTGAPSLATSAALRSAAGYVRLSVPGGVVAGGAPVEAVARPLPSAGWAEQVLDGAERFGAVVVGPGLGTDPGDADQVRDVVRRCPVPVVVDGDGLRAVAGSGPVTDRARATVLTPHVDEYRSLMGEAPGDDRIEAARAAASAYRAVVLLKGPTTVVASPDGRVALVRSGDQRLATAGSGDVLSGIIGSLLAAGAEPLEAAAAAAHVHGRAATLGPATGLVAGDLPALVPLALEEIRGTVR